jgi:hypothetical protein
VAADVCCLEGKRQLLRNSRDVWKVGLPILLWGIVVIIVYATSMQQLDMVSARSCQIMPDHARSCQIMPDSAPYACCALWSLLLSATQTYGAQH